MDVVFVVPPFADLNRPAIGVSLLKAGIAREGFASTIEYFNIRLAERIGFGLYQQIANSFASESLIGEWFFADVVFGDSLPDESEYIRKILGRYCSQAALANEIIEARQCRSKFIEECVHRILELKPRVVGFTTTFHQTCPCLAIAKQLKQSPDAPITIFGGANCEGEMGMQLIRSFPWIDYVSTGEADIAFPALLRNILREDANTPVAGMLKREEAEALTWPERVKDMDSLPIPDYFDYFGQVKNSPLQSEIRPDLLIETSRGCWWGAKHHCTFCGLNGDSMAFRSKSPERVFDELASLSETYEVKRVDCVDNILDTRYINTLFPKLSDSGLKLDLFYEVKANLRYDQLARLRAGGIQSIQPGIESFSNEVLRIMRKGCTGLQNIQLLRWCVEMDIKVGWNLLAGFPDEPVSEYQLQAELVPLITHLQAPASCTPVRLDRFSPLFTQAQDFNLTRLRPSPAYFHVYPLGRRELSRLAYCFDFDYSDGRDPNGYIRDLRHEVQQWWAQHQDPDNCARLDAVCGEDTITITDTRAVAVANQHQLSSIAAQLYLYCDAARSLTAIYKNFCPVMGESEIRNLLDEALALKIMIEMDDHYLSLAIIRNRPKKDKIEENVYTEIQKTPNPLPLLHLV